MDQFWLGTHHPNWLGTVGVPLCVSRRRLSGMKRLPRAQEPWLLDSGGFSELHLHGRWTLTPKTYVAEVRRYAEEIGLLALAAPQDWMCEPFVLAKTGRSVGGHQLLTAANYLELLDAAPELPWFPVLQGWAPEDYLRHADLYDSLGIDLASLTVVGVGSICRRQHTAEAVGVLRRLASDGLRLHGFGLKIHGLLAAQDSLASADSMSWSFTARRLRYPWCGSTKHINCANCAPYALHWRERLLTMLARRLPLPS